MASRFHKLRTRQNERSVLTSHGAINLVPLVDILTSIVFFSLLTYTGAVMTSLTAFDLTLPPVMVTQTSPGAPSDQRDTTTLILAVGVRNDMIRVEHSNGGAPPFAQNISGVGTESLAELLALLQQIKEQFPDADAAMVVPEDDTSYDNIVHVLEQVKRANFPKIALSSARRSQQVAAAPGGR